MNVRQIGAGTHVIFASDDPDDVFYMLAGGAIIVNPNSRPRYINFQGEVRELTAAELSRWEFDRTAPKR